MDLAPKQYPSELFVNDRPAKVARWPKDQFATIQVAANAQHAQDFTLDPTPPKTWIEPLSLFAFGYWGNDWADAYLPAKLQDGLLTFTDRAPPYGLRDGQRGYLSNFPEALSDANDWYLDPVTATVYVVAPLSRASNSLEISITQRLIELHGTSHVIIRNLTIEDSREILISADAVTDLSVQSCTLRNAGHVAISITHAVRSGVDSCDIFDSGGTGVSLEGGDRRSLVASDNYVRNSRIAHFGRTFRTYEPGIRVEGVGAQIQHNTIAGGPHIAIWFSGNDHRIDHNEIRDVITETGDAGAIYSGRDWTARGTIIEGNYLHDISGVGAHGATGVYLDDQASGTTVRGNLFLRAHRGVLVGGGSDNIVVGNLFVNVPIAVSIDSRGMTWERAASLNPNGQLQKNLRAVPFSSSTYTAKYPELTSLITDGLGIPRRNTISTNLAIRSSPIQVTLDTATASLQSIETNWTTDDPRTVWNHVVDLLQTSDVDEFRLDPDSPWIRKGFRPLALGSLGPKL